MTGRPRQERRRKPLTGPALWGALTAAVVVAAALALGLLWRGESPAEPPWNVVLITLDTTRADRLGCYGARQKTPTIDALASRGVRVERCFAAVPLTLPSHASLMTGLTSARHGVHDNGPERVPREAHTLAEVLKGHGYVTAAVVGAFVLDRQFGLDQGFDQYDDQMPDNPAESRFSDAQRNAAQVTDAALAWLAEKRNAPVFLWVHYFDPHAPYFPPDYNPKLATLEPYDAEIAYVDAQLKRLLNGVERQLGAQTLIILTADHGEGLGQHGELTHGLFTYNQTLRVPLIVRFPDALHGGRVVHEPASLIDVMPSVLAWLKFAEPATLDGVPLPLEDAAAPNEMPPRPLYFENRFPTNMYGWSAVEGIVLGRHKYIRAPRSEVYDLEQDPGERNNLFEVNSELSQRLMKAFEEVAARHDSLPALSASAADVSDDELKRLRSLGYVGAGKPSSGAPTPPPENLPDPKDMVAVYQQIQDVSILFDRDQSAQATEILVNVLEAGDPANKRALRLAAAMSLDESPLRLRVIACLLQQALAKDRPCIDAFVLGKLGRTLLGSNRPADARDVLARLVQVDASSAAACRYLAQAFEELGDASQAEHWRAQALKLARASDQRPDWDRDGEEQHRLAPEH